MCSSTRCIRCTRDVCSGGASPPTESALIEYGRTSAEGLSASGSDPEHIAAAQRWKQSPFYRMLQTGDSLLRRRLAPDALAEFTVLPEMHAAGMTDYVAIINRFAAEGTIGDMDCVYSSWATGEPDGFSDGQIAALQRIVPFLALAIKSVSLARMTGTLMQTYLGRDAGQRVLSGRILRGVADRIDAVIWFSDLRGFTRITDTAPEQVIPLLNDYADVDRLGHSRAWRRCSQADRRRHARDLHGRRSGARVERRAVGRHRRASGRRRAEPAPRGG